MSIIGETYGRWTVLNDELPKQKVLCRCSCGVEREVHKPHLLRGKSKSCGCYKLERTTKHGGTNSPEYHSWQAMKNRCLNPNHPAYHNYGGRGIGICDEWVNDFAKFLEDMGTRLVITQSLDRIDVDGNYEPSNCRWATCVEQNNNKRNNR